MENFLGLRREITDHWVYSDIYAFRVWMHILLRAQYSEKPNTFKHNGYWVTQEYSEFVYGRDSWSTQLQVPERRLKTIMDRLERDGMIKRTVKTLPRGSVYSVVNYEKYNQRNVQRDSLEPQALEGDAVQRNVQRTSSESPANVQPTSNIKIDKKDKIEKKSIIAANKTKSRTMTSYTPEFEEFLSCFPNRLQKKLAFDRWNKRLKDGEFEEAMITSARNYKEYCELKGTEQKFWKHPENFINDDKLYVEFIEGIPEGLLPERKAGIKKWAT